MTHREGIHSHLSERPGLCDDCVTSNLRISRRQIVYRLCSNNPAIRRSRGTCVDCKRSKIVSTVQSAPTADRSPTNPTPRPRKNAVRYLREEYLRTRFNQSIATTLSIASDDYYGRLSFSGLLKLKEGYARIHDIITLKLTQALVARVGDRLRLGRHEVEAMGHAVNIIHPNASGFDLDCRTPNIIGEVKGCIPVNQGNSFGAAQVKSLTYDVLQMRGVRPQGKQGTAVSVKSKINRTERKEATKFLGLYASSEVRAAAGKWRRNLVKSDVWKSLSPFSIEELPDTGALSPDTIYIIYLSPDHSYKTTPL
jgi:hypothetical protein